MINNDIQKEIELYERLAKIEELLRHIIKEQDEQNVCDKDLSDKIDKKIDKILDNDKDKLQRITKVEQKITNIKTTLYLFALPIAAAIVRSFM